MTEAYIYDALRTPRGKGRKDGSLHEVTALRLSALTMNAPRHSDHHSHPNRTYAALILPQDGPMLPRSLPVMAFVALYPPRWRALMDPLALKAQPTPAHTS